MKSMGEHGWAVGAVALLVGVGVGSALADLGPDASPVHYSGRILVDGAAAPDAMHAVKLDMFTGPTGLAGLLCENGVANVQTRNGYFSVPLNAACMNAFEQNDAVYVALEVDGTALPTRQRAGAVPFAVRAVHAQALGAPRRIMATTTEYTGNLVDGSFTGYAAARSICGTLMNSATAHICYGSELARARQQDMTIPAGTYLTETPLLDANGSVLAEIADCDRFRSHDGQLWHQQELFPSRAGDGPIPCSAMAPIVCCD